MNYDSIMLHYGELSTKGANKKAFIQCLLHNVRVALKKFEVVVKGNRDHIYVFLEGKDPSPIIARLQEVSGIQKLSLVAKLGKTPEEIETGCLELIKLEKGQTFKIDVNRADKTFPMSSYDLTVRIADYILDHSSLTVDLHDKDIFMKVNVRDDGTYVSCHEFPGIGGYPLGMNGKVLLLLSGGIDSPVAAYSLIRRGIRVEALHFASPPYTSWAVIDKLKDLLKTLNEYQADIKLEVVPFTKLQEAIYQYVPEPYCITIMRRMMMRIAVKVAKKNKCLAIATGESIGQVASQTLESIQVINDVTNFPVLRPLAVEDKVHIIDISKHIGTYEISIRPYEDCCTIFKPKKPKTKPHLDEAEHYESKFDWEPLVEECANSLTAYYLSEGEEVESKAQPQNGSVNEEIPE